MTQYKVTPEELSIGAVSCDTTASEVEQKLATLKSYVVNLEASWQGIAATTFQGLMQEYDVFSTMLHNALADIASGLRGTYVNYSESEQANIDTITKLQNMLPANLS